MSKSDSAYMWGEHIKKAKKEVAKEYRQAAKSKVLEGKKKKWSGKTVKYSAKKFPGLVKQIREDEGESKSYDKHGNEMY